mmetsp:Transcript_10911/g.24003  ORF Transcript_10911/g.24003 Transcript_10911/m.24003 type:complete len:253 (-) Transcript_10911:99-857(-)
MEPPSELQTLSPDFSALFVMNLLFCILSHPVVLYIAPPCPLVEQDTNSAAVAYISPTLYMAPPLDALVHSEKMHLLAYTVAFLFTVMAPPPLLECLLVQASNLIRTSLIFFFFAATSMQGDFEASEEWREKSISVTPFVLTASSPLVPPAFILQVPPGTHRITILVLPEKTTGGWFEGFTISNEHSVNVLPFAFLNFLTAFFNSFHDMISVQAVSPDSSVVAAAALTTKLLDMKKRATAKAEDVRTNLVNIG